MLDANRYSIPENEIGLTAYSHLQMSEALQAFLPVRAKGGVTS